MRSLILAALLAATAVPALAQVPPPAPVPADTRQDRRDTRDDRRDVRQDNAQVRGDRADVRQDNRGVRQDERQLNRDAAQGGVNPQDRRELRQDERRDFQDRRDVRQDDRRGYDDRRDVRQDERRDYRDDRRDGRDFRDGRDGRRDFREAYRDDRRGYGPGDGYARYRGPQFYYPRGYGYRYYGIGAILPRVFFDQRYYIADPFAYRLPPAYAGTRWVRVGPDALLIRAYDGRVVRVIQGLFY